MWVTDGCKGWNHNVRKRMQTLLHSSVMIWLVKMSSIKTNLGILNWSIELEWTEWRNSLCPVSEYLFNKLKWCTNAEKGDLDICQHVSTVSGVYTQTKNRLLLQLLQGGQVLFRQPRSTNPHFTQAVSPRSAYWLFVPSINFPIVKQLMQSNLTESYQRNEHTSLIENCKPVKKCYLQIINSQLIED